MADEDDVDASGCGLLLGLIITSVATGYISTNSAYGWLVFGVGIIILHLCSRICRWLSSL